MMMILNDNDVLVMLREYDRVSVRARRHWAAARHASIDTPTYRTRSMSNVFVQTPRHHYSPTHDSPHQHAANPPDASSLLCSPPVPRRWTCLARVCLRSATQPTTTTVVVEVN